jgi:hypothetical protein
MDVSSSVTNGLLDESETHRVEAQKKEAEILDKKHEDAWVLLHGQPPHPHALIQEESNCPEDYYYNHETGESSRIGPARAKRTGPKSTQLVEGEPWWVSDKNQQDFDVVMPPKKISHVKLTESNVQRSKDFVVDFDGLVNHHGAYKEARHQVDKSVRKQTGGKREKTEDAAAHDKDLTKQMEQLRISATTGKPTLNSVINRTKMQDYFQLNEWHSGEESLALRRSFVQREFCLTGAGVTTFPSLLCNTLTSI